MGRWVSFKNGKMKKKFKYVLISISLVFLGCKKELYFLDAKIIEFDANKCACCWGWTIDTGEKLIKSSSSKIGDAVGFTIDEPIAVEILLGQKDGNCDKLYEIEEIKIK